MLSQRDRIRSRSSGRQRLAWAVVCVTLLFLLTQSVVFASRRAPWGEPRASVPQPSMRLATGAIGGTVWHDVDRNGAREGGEPPLAGAHIALWNAQRIIAQHVTGADGMYLFEGLQPDVYSVIETDPAGYVSTTPNHRTVELRGEETVQVDFGDVPRAVGRFFVDLPLIMRRRVFAPPTPTATPTATATPGLTWTIGAGSGEKRINALVRAGSTCSEIYAGVDDLGLYRSVDAGATWQRRGLDGTVMDIAIMPWNDDALYVATWGLGVRRTIDGGTQWMPLNDGLDDHLWLYAIVFNAPANTLYVGTGADGVYKSTDGGNHWQSVNLGLTDLNVRSLALASPAGQEVVYAGTLGNGVFKSTDGGAHWVKVGPGSQRIRHIAIDPGAPDTLYLATDDGVFRSSDGGATWPEDYHKIIGQRIYAVVVDPLDSSLVYAARETYGVYRSANQALSWEPMNNGLPAGTSIHALVATRDALGACPYLVAGSAAGGLWTWK